MSMFLFVVSLILAAVAVCLLFFKWEEHKPRKVDRYSREVVQEEEVVTHSLKPFALIPIFLIALAFPLMFLAKVPPNNVGVLTSYGHVYDDTLGSGLHFKMPWQNVEDVDATRQTDTYRGKSDDACADSAILITRADGGRSCVWFNDSWRIKKSAADVAFKDYKPTDEQDRIERVRANILSPKLKGALQTVVSQVFNPLEALRAAAQDAKESGVAKSVSLDFDPDLAEINRLMKIEMDKVLGDDPVVEFISIDVTLVSVDGDTQGRLNAFTAEVGNTRVETQRILTNTQKNLANQALSTAINKNPLVLVDKCLDIWATLADKGIAPSSATSCWDQAANSGVVVGVK